MGQHLQKYLTVLIGAFLTLLLSFVSDFVLSLSRETTWIIFFGRFCNNDNSVFVGTKGCGHGFG